MYIHKTLKKFLNSGAMPFIALFFAMLIINIFKSTSVADDIWFAKCITGDIDKNITNIFSYFSWRYKNWSSRLIIEFFLIYFAKNFAFLWKILDAGIFVLLAYSIYRVFCNFNKEYIESKYIKWLVVFLVFLISQNLLCSAGWIATTLNYSWIIAFGVFSLIPIRKCIDSQKINWYEYLIFILSMLFACNQEQMCAILFTVYAIFTLYLLKKKKIKPIILILFIISIISLIFILTCPGNRVRTTQEILHFFNNFENLTLLNKVEISLVSTMQYFIFNFNIIYVIFTGLMMLKLYKKYKNNILVKAIVTFPFVIGVAFNIFSPIIQIAFPDIYNVISIMNVQNNASFVGNSQLGFTKSWLPVVISGFNLILIILSVYLCFGKSEKGIIAILCISAGIATRILMGFIPTVYASGNRTQLIFIVTMLIVSILLISEENKETLKKYINGLIIFEILTFMNNVALSLNIR